MEPVDATAAAHPSPVDPPVFEGLAGFQVTAAEPAIGSPGDGSDRMVCVVLTSEATPERADALARALLEQRLVACVSVLPVRSHYRWQGALETADEVKLLLQDHPGSAQRPPSSPPRSARLPDPGMDRARRQQP